MYINDPLPLKELRKFALAFLLNLSITVLLQRYLPPLAIFYKNKNTSLMPFIGSGVVLLLLPQGHFISMFLALKSHQLEDTQAAQQTVKRGNSLHRTVSN